MAQAYRDAEAAPVHAAHDGGLVPEAGRQGMTGAHAHTEPDWGAIGRSAAGGVANPPQTQETGPAHLVEEHVGGHTAHPQQMQEAGPAHVLEETPVVSVEERERQLAVEDRKLRAREEKLGKQADTYVEKVQRDAQAKAQHEMAKADKNAEKAIAKAAHKESNVHKKVEQKLAEAASDRKKAEIDAEHRAAEKKAEAQKEAEEMVAAAQEKAAAVKRGEEVLEKPSTIKKVLGLA